MSLKKRSFVCTRVPIRMCSMIMWQKYYQHYVKQYAGVQFCTAAHTHHHQDDVIFDDGIHYVTSDCMDYRTYLVFTITPEKYEYELVKY